MRDPALGTGGAYSVPDRTIVHFGSPAGATYDEHPVDGFKTAHPDFVFPESEAGK